MASRQKTCQIIALGFRMEICGEVGKGTAWWNAHQHALSAGFDGKEKR